MVLVHRERTECMVCCSIERERERIYAVWCDIVYVCMCIYAALFGKRIRIYTLYWIYMSVCAFIFGDISQCHGRTIDIHVPEMSTERRWDFCRPFFYCAS
jgi:tyrosine-protein phosphatase YwqE